MTLRTGCDLVFIPRFRERVRQGGETLLARLFSPSEYLGQPLERLAGLFAAKESVCKALNYPPGRWLDMRIEHEPSGAPKVVLLDCPWEVLDMSVSITHEGDYALAFFVAQTE
jgi:phosphopantetheine--protein transferase-like protein